MGRSTETSFRPCLVVWLLISVFYLSGCVTAYPYRTQLNEAHSGCGASDKTNDCKHQAPEVGREYELHFVEFDDQGWLHPAGVAGRGEASKQLDWLMSHLRRKLEQGKELSIVLFVHGWKHNADYRDTNVAQFRRVLQGVYTMEQATPKKETNKPREIIGIYIGWRGKSLALPEPLINITFWDRKAAALRVAQGSVRELLSRLNQFHKFHAQDCRAEQTQEHPRCRIQLLLVGHSFGAWVLYSAIAESLMANLTAARDTGEKATRANRYGDMVLLINPAFEGSRYEQLHQAAQRRVYEEYQAPILVIVTSAADLATRYAFPVGRWVNTLLQRPASSTIQTEAIGHTAGHIERYLSHELTKEKGRSAECSTWQGSPNLPEADKSAQLAKNVAAERQNQYAFFKRMAKQHPKGEWFKLQAGWGRRFCGGAVLTHMKDKWARTQPHVPIWNVRADASIIPGHNEIDSVEFLAFIRQLYLDARRFPVAVE